MSLNLMCLLVQIAVADVKRHVILEISTSTPLNLVLEQDEFFQISCLLLSLGGLGCNGFLVWGLLEPSI